MKKLTVNGVAFEGELPGEWTLPQLIRAIDNEVLAEGEVAVEIRVDGEEMMRNDDPRTLADVDVIEIVASHITEVVARAVETSKVSLARFGDELGKAVDSFQVGEEPRGWAAYQRSLATLGMFVGVAERIVNVMTDGFTDGEAKAQEIRDFSQTLGERLQEMESASADRDVITLCDCAEDLSAWSQDAWSAVWTGEQA